MLKVIAYLALGILGLAVGVVALPFGIMLVFGVTVPLIVGLGMPLRVAFVLAKARRSFKLLFAALLLPWAYCASQVAQHGYVSAGAQGTGPTVNPWIWSCIGMVWLLLELRIRLAKRMEPSESHVESA